MDVQLAVGRRNAELVEEDPAELVVVVLTGVDQQLLRRPAELARYCRCFHELWPISENCRYCHNVTSLRHALFSGQCCGCLARHGAASPTSRGTSRTGSTATSVRALRPDGLQLLLDARAKRLSGLARCLTRRRCKLAPLDRGDRLNLARGRCEECLGGVLHVVERGRPLLHVERAQHAVACDRGKDVLVEWRRA